MRLKIHFINKCPFSMTHIDLVRKINELIDKKT